MSAGTIEWCWRASCNRVNILYRASCRTVITRDTIMNDYGMWERNVSIKKLSLPCFLLVAVALSSHAAEAPVVWQRFDQSADLAALARLENERMHYLLLQSGMLDKNSLWAPFAEALSAFTEADYEALKPLILDQPIAALQQAVAGGRLSYEQLTTFYIYRIRRIESDPARYLNGVIALNPDAVVRARMLDELRSQNAGTGRNAVFGMPVLLKDNVGAAGMATTAGAVALQDNFTGNAFVTERLLENGAVILGKANLSEWAYFFCEDCPSGYSAMGGQTLNPYGRLEFNTGGSSAGSGAAIAANYAAVAVGSETSGSILSPSSANSLVGLKPTTGSLSRTGVVPISATLDTTGPMARSVADAVVLFNAMTGYDEADRAMPLPSVGPELIYREVSLSGKRLGALEQFIDDSHYQNALSLLSANEASVVDVNLDYERDEGFSELLGGEMVRDLALYLEQHASDSVGIDSIASLRDYNNMNPALRAPYGQELVDMMDELTLTTGELEALRERLQSTARAALDSLFTASRLDVLLSINNRHAGLAALANYPALTVPMGYQDNGRPVGLTLIAPSFEEQVLIDVGARFEQLSEARETPADYR